MMKDIMSKLSNLEATAPKPKKMLTEDSTSPMITEPKARSLKDVFNEISETVAPGQKPLPVLDPSNKQAGMGFVTSSNPAVQNMLKNLDPKDVQIVQAPGQQQQQQQQQGQPAPGGATGQPQQGQMQMREAYDEKTIITYLSTGDSDYDSEVEVSYDFDDYGDVEITGVVDAETGDDMYELLSDHELDSLKAEVESSLQDERDERGDWEYEMSRDRGLGESKKSGKMLERDEGKPGKNFAKIAKSAGKRYGSKEAGERVAGAVRAKLAKQGKLEEEQIDELSDDTLKSYLTKSKHSSADAWRDSDGNVVNHPSKAALKTLSKRYKGQSAAEKKLASEGAKVDRMVKHIEKSERKLGKSKDEAEDIAWATANKRGMLDNKNKKKVKESQVNEIFGFSNKEKNIKAVKAWLASNGTNAANSDLWPERSPRFSVMRGTDSPNRRIDGELTRDGRLILQISTQQGHQVGRSEKAAQQWKSPQTAERNIDDPKFIPWFNQQVGASPVKEGDIPSTQGIDTKGAGLGAGRSDEVLEGKKPDFLDLDKDGNKKESMKKAAADKKKKKVDESMNHRINAARLEGKSHGLRGHAYHGKAYEDLEEMKAYHEGYKEGMDELYEMGMYETAPANPPASVGGMANQAIQEMAPDTFTQTTFYSPKVEGDVRMGNWDHAVKYKNAGWLGPDTEVTYFHPQKHITVTVPAKDAPHLAHLFDVAEGNAFTDALARTPKGGKFSVGGKSFTDNSSLEEYAFESLDRQLNALLNEGEDLSEGLSVSVSKGQQNSPDSVTITAQDAEADQLLQLVKHAGLGLFGDDNAEPSSAMSIQPSHGEPDEVGAGGVDLEVVDGNDGMMGLMQKLSGIQSDGEGDEDYADEEGGEEEHTCNECGMMEAECHCNEEQVEEVQTPDQLEAEVAEDNAPDSGAEDSVADEDAEAKEDAALAGEKEEEMNESFFDLLSRLNRLAESKDEEDEDYDPEEDGPDHGKAWSDTSDELKEDEEESEDLNEWANQVGSGEGKGTDASFEQDIEFMTKVIAGGLNKPKSTGQTTVPVIAGQEDRMHDNPQDWATLAGIKK